MEQAYLKASANGTLPAHARQIMYAARPYIQTTADRDLGARFDQYFTQQLLPDYIEAQRRHLERRLRRPRPFPRAAHRARRLRSGPCRSANYLDRRPSLRDPGARLQTVGGALSDLRPAASLRRRAVHREGRLHAAVRGGEARRALRPRHHVDQGHERHRQPRAGRGTVRQSRDPAARAARLRQVRLLDRRDPAARHPPLCLLARVRDPRPRASPRGRRRPRDRGSDAQRQR